MLNCYQVPTSAILWCFVMLPDHSTWGSVKHFGDPPVLVEPSRLRRNRRSCRKWITLDPPYSSSNIVFFCVLYSLYSTIKHTILQYMYIYILRYMIWYDAIRYDTIWHHITSHDTTRHDMIRHDMIPENALYFSPHSTQFVHAYK